jgi:hypothetical protein
MLYDLVFLFTYSTVMLGSIQKFTQAGRKQNSTQWLLVFIVLTSEKIKPQSEEQTYFYRRKKPIMTV